MSDADALLDASQRDLFWLPADARAIDRADVTYLACPRNERHLNVVMRTDAPDEALAELQDEVARAHEGVESRWTLRGASLREGIERRLAAAGYAPEARLDAYTVAVDAYRAPHASEAMVVRCVDDLAGLRACVQVATRAFGRVHSVDPAVLARDLAACTGATTRVRRFVVYDRGTDEPVASAGFTAFPTLSFGLLWAGGTVPEARGRGAYAALVAARVAHARSIGLRQVGLYARTDTSAPSVARAGFVRGRPTVHWLRPRP